MIASLAFAAVAAAIVGVATYCVVQLQRTELAHLAATAATANAASAAANEAAARAHERAEQERLERLKLEAKYAPRRLTREIAQPMIDRLSAFKGKRVRLVSYVSDVEGAVLATELHQVLTKSGMAIDDGRMSIQSFGSLAFGVLIDGRDPKLRDALVAAFIVSPVQAGPASPLPHNLSTTTTADAVVLVAAKPLDNK